MDGKRLRVCLFVWLVGCYFSGVKSLLELIISHISGSESHKSLPRMGIKKKMSKIIKKMSKIIEC